MAKQIADRLSWTVELLDVQPDDQILEIGCGNGTALSLICEKLTSGKITAMDRSETMIAAARKKNSLCLDAGKADLLTASLDQANFTGAGFDKIFAVNVNVFWLKPAKELEVIKQVLKADGMLFLIYEPPHSSKIPTITDQLKVNLEKSGFSVSQIIETDLKSSTAVCVTAKSSNNNK